MTLLTLLNTNQPPPGVTAKFSADTAALAINDGVPADTLAAYTFNEGTGTTAAEVNGGTPIDEVPGWAAGRHGNAMFVNGTIGPIIDPFLGSTSDMTMSADIYMTGRGTMGYNMIFHNTGGTSTLQTLGSGAMEWYPATGQTAALNLNQWYNVTIVANGTTHKVYLDGVEVLSGNYNLRPTASPWQLGSQQDAYQSQMRYDNLRVWNRALSAAEIAARSGTEVTPAASATNVVKTTGGPTQISGTDTASLSVAEAAGTFFREITATDGAAISAMEKSTFTPTSILMATAGTSPNADEIKMRDRLISMGHQVTTQGSTSLTKETALNYGLLIVTSGGSPSDSVLSDLFIPVVNLNYTRVNAMRLSTVSPTLANNVSSVNQAAEGVGHSINAGVSFPLNFMGNLNSNRYLPSSQIVASATNLLQFTTDESQINAFVVEAGAELTTGIAPARRAVWMQAASAVNAWTEAGLDYFERLVKWSIEPQPVAYRYGSESTTIAVNDGGDLNKGINNRQINPSFEEPLGSIITANTSVIRTADATAWDGANVATVAVAESGGSGASTLFEPIPVLPNTQYTVALRYRLRSGTVSGSPRLAVRTYNTLGSGVNTLNSSFAVDPDATWRTHSTTFTTGAEATTLRIGYATTIGSVSEIDFDGLQVNLGPTLLAYDPASNTDSSLAGSDTAALAVTETTSLFITKVANDGAVVSVGEVASSYGTSTRTDTSSLAVGENASVSISLVVNDGATFILSESTAVAGSNTVVANDTSGLSLADTAAVVVAFTTTDTVALSVSDTTTTFKEVVASEAIAITATESSNIGSSVPGSDTAAVAVVEQATIAVSVSTNDTTAVAVSETVTAPVFLSRTDTTALTITDTASLLTTRYLTTDDSVALSVAETATNRVTSSTTDTAALAVSETTAMSKFITVSDSDSLDVVENTTARTDVFQPGFNGGSLGVVDTSDVLVMVSVTDDNIITVHESATILVRTSVSDIVSFGLEEQAGMYIDRAISANDTIALSVDESTVSTIALTRNDTVAISVVEATEFFRAMAVSDGLGIALTETATNFVTASDDDELVIGLTESTASFRTLSDSDTLSIAMDDDGSMFKAVEANDSIDLTVTCVANVTTSAPAQDSAALAVVEQASIFGTFSAEDSLALGLDESASVHVSLVASDESALAVSDAGLLFLTKSATDGGTILVSELATDSVIGAEQASDTATFSMTESASVNIGVIAADTSSLTITETTSTNVVAMVYDTSSVAVAESRAQFGSNAGNDSVAVSVDETAAVAQFVTLSQADGGTLMVSETATVDVRIARSDISSISVSEAITQHGSRPGADTLTVGLQERTAITRLVGEVSPFSTQPGADPSTLSVTETTHIRMTVQAVDTGSVGVVDSGQAVGREADTVLVLVYQNGEWTNGTMMVYRAGAWRVAKPTVYRNGQWAMD